MIADDDGAAVSTHPSVIQVQRVENIFIYNQFYQEFDISDQDSYFWT